MQGNDLISREAAMLAIHNAQTAAGWSNGMHEMDIHKALAKVPAVDAVPVVHGRWILLDECSNEGFYCSRCHKKVYRKDYANQKVKSNYCPNCLAKMDGGEDNG